tara:strand:- start:9313 stop:9816 length:504 start_codon:yes stop_codon:yes gene_type:complete
MPKDVEIERKFLMRVNPFRFDYDDVLEIHQCYLPRDEEGFTVRYRAVANEGVAVYFKTRKKSISDMSCTELEEKVTKMEYDRAEESSLKSLVKLRYRKKIGDLVWEVDDFLTSRLMLAEVELPSEDHEFDIPKDIEICMMMEVTGMEAFYNENIAITDAVAATQIRI